MSSQSQIPVGDDDEDRKRIKERLKEAVENDKRARARVIKAVHRESWLEYVFGICEPDRRVGKQGSRSGYRCHDFVMSELFNGVAVHNRFQELKILD